MVMELWMIFEAKKELERIGGVEYLEQGDIGRTMRRECVVTKGGNRAKARPRPSHYRSRHCRRHCHHHHPYNQPDRGHRILIFDRSAIQNPKSKSYSNGLNCRSPIAIAHFGMKTDFLWKGPHTGDIYMSGRQKGCWWKTVQNRGFVAGGRSC